MAGRWGSRANGSRTVRAIARMRAEAEGIDLDAALWAVVQSMLAKGAAGDVGAARLCFETLGAPDRLEVEISGPELSDTERAQRVAALVAMAEGFARSTGPARLGFADGPGDRDDDG